jgi:hypothetical protein
VIGMTTDQETPGLHCAPIPRADAVGELAQLLAGHGWFVIVLAPEVVTAGLSRLNGISECRYFMDNGTEEVYTVTGEQGGEAAALPNVLLGDGVQVVVAAVPKSVPANRLAELLGVRIDQPDKQDLIILQGPSGQTGWPVLLLDAMELFEPGSTASIRTAARP